MSDYPTLPIAESFVQTPRDGRQMDTAADGLSRIRKLHADRYDFTVPHPVLTAAQVATLEAHYASNGVASFNFTSPQDSVTYSVAYAARPTYRLHLGGLKTATVKLTQTA